STRRRRHWSSSSALSSPRFTTRRWRRRSRNPSARAASSPRCPHRPRIGAVNEDGAPDFEQLVRDALDELHDDISGLMTNVAVTVEDESPRGPNLLGLYEGVPWGRRGPYYAGALPDKITIYRIPLERISGGDPEQLRFLVRRTVFHEIAHHFGISDQRLVDIDRY